MAYKAEYKNAAGEIVEVYIHHAIVLSGNRNLDIESEKIWVGKDLSYSQKLNALTQFMTDNGYTFVRELEAGCRTNYHRH